MLSKIQQTFNQTELTIKNKKITKGKHLTIFFFLDKTLSRKKKKFFLHKIKYILLHYDFRFK